MGHARTMKAMVLPALGAPLRLETVSVPGIGAGDVLLRVRATGVGLTVLRQRRIRAVVSRTFPLEGAEEAHALLRRNALVGRAALLQPH